MKQEILNNTFKKTLIDRGYPLEDIQRDMQMAQGKKPGPLRVLRNWTGLSSKTVRDGVLNEERDMVSPKLNAAILALVEPWTAKGANQVLPDIRVKEVARIVGLAPEKVVDILTKYRLSFSVNGADFYTYVEAPEFPERRLDLSDARRYNLSPSRVARAARYLSKAPGGGPVQKSGLQNKNVNNQIRKSAWQEVKIVFKRTADMVSPTESRINRFQDNQSVEKFIYQEAEGEKIMEVFRWLKKTGAGKNWVFGNNELKLAENLVSLSRGKSVDFLLWNCIGFEWIESFDRKKPSCNVKNNLDTSIAIYFSERISELTAILAEIGNPQLTILLPTNEAFDERWAKYIQPYEERDRIVNEIASGIDSNLSDLPIPGNAQIRVMRWDEYLQSKGVTRKPEEYSSEGELKLRSSPSFSRIRRNAIVSERDYFRQYGLKDVDEDELADEGIVYYGIYAGEGIAFEELQSKGNGIVIVNFEESRVAQMESLGANNNLSIITPANNSEITEYYRWKTKKIMNGD